MSAIAKSAGTPVKILIAEDSPTQAQQLQHILEHKGYHVTTTANGLQAFETARHHKPTLIISDIVMPEMDGYELCRRVKADAHLADVPVILVTTLSDPQDVICGLECRADNFILKPYDERQLLARVQFVLVNHEMRQTEQPGMGLEIFFNGQKHFIAADRLQILNLLLSTYDAAMQRNKELSRAQDKLREANSELQQLTLDLENRVTHRTRELKRSNEALRESKQLLDSFINNATTVICVKDLAGRFLMVNRRFEELFHTTQAEILGKTDYDLFPKEQADAFRAVDQQVAASGQVVEAEEVAPLDDGLHTYISIKFPLFDAADRPYAMGGISTDITGRKRTEQTLREAEERTRLIVETALDAVITMDSCGVITGWNAQAEATFGWTHEEVVGRVLRETIIPERYGEAHEHGLRRYLATGQGPVLNKRIEITALHRQGHEFPVELAITPIRLGDHIFFSAFVRDITEHKLAQQKLQAQLARLSLLQQITRAIGERQDLPSIFQAVIRSLEDDLPVDFCCVCLYDQKANTLTVTKVGVKSQSFALDLVMPEQARIGIDQNGLSQCVRGQLVHEPDISQVQFPFPQRLARGGLRSVVFAPLLVESNVFGVLVAARKEAHGFSSGDCEFLRQLSEHTALAAHQAQLYTALQQAYDDLRQTQKAVMQQERLRALGQMASGIAHDINNAISPVALYTESLLEKEPNLSARARDYLQTIQRSIGDVAETVARMREFYRQREPQLALASVHLNHLVQQVVDLTRARWSDMPQQRGIVIQMQTELVLDLPAIMGVESEIRETLTNLVFNAVDAMPDGGTLTLRTGVTESAPSSEMAPTLRHVHAEVTDTGIGMDEDTKRRCLEPFFTTKGERGTGLGLAMVYGVAQRHSGDIEIESALGKGTTVRLSFPVPAKVVAGPTESAAVFTAPSRLRLLIVDDDPVLIKSLRDTLETDGHLVVTAKDGQEAIGTIHAAQDRSEPFAAVITDLGMPYVDGRKVASTVKAASPSTPVILLTGWGQRLLDEGDIPPHVDRVLSKPPKLRELREALAHCCPPAGS
jgi:PAS domain S-box-containing protein